MRWKEMTQRRIQRGERERERMEICPGPRAIKPGGRNWFLDDRRANQPRKVLSFPKQEVRIEDWCKKADILLLGVLSRAYYPAILWKMLLLHSSTPSPCKKTGFLRGRHMLAGSLPGHSKLALCKKAGTSQKKKSEQVLDVSPCTKE